MGDYLAKIRWVLLSRSVRKRTIKVLGAYAGAGNAYLAPMSRTILPLIVLAQFCCTSVWFAGNAVMTDMVAAYSLGPAALGSLTSAIQFGFICGTLVFAILAIADRFSPSRVFMVSALVAAGMNVCPTVEGNTLATLLVSRFVTGFCLAGIYPVGMKIASDYFDKGLGRSLGYLVGALVLGTAFPHLLRSFEGVLPWRFVFVLTSGIAALGGLLIGAFVPDGPHRRSGQRPELMAFTQVFQKQDFRRAAFGYFGHMWELYTFWAFVPLLIKAYSLRQASLSLNVPLLSFGIIAVGGVACVLGGYLSERFGVRSVARCALSLSGICCLVLPVFFLLAPMPLFLALLFFWGMVVVMDSPLFSTLVAQSADPALKGTALTIVNCLGFGLTIVSIQLLSYLLEQVDLIWVYPLLAMGPLLGVMATSSASNCLRKANVN